MKTIPASKKVDVPWQMGRPVSRRAEAIRTTVAVIGRSAALPWLSRFERQLVALRAAGELEGRGGTRRRAPQEAQDVTSMMDLLKR